MSLERTGSEPRPLLPDALENSLVGGLLKSTGFVLTGLALAGWLSLITWSADDPSLTHATSGLTRNWLGAFGAIVSDLLLQTLGFVAVLVYLGAAFCGLELLLRQRIAGLKFRLWIFPLAIVTLAGACAALPVPPTWPLNHSLGGMAGDSVFRLLAGLLAMLNPGRAGMVTGLVLFAAGMGLLSAGLGLTQREWAILFQRNPTATPASLLMAWIKNRVAHAVAVQTANRQAQKSRAAQKKAEAVAAAAASAGEAALAQDIAKRSQPPPAPRAAPMPATAATVAPKPLPAPPQPIRKLLSEPSERPPVFPVPGSPPSGSANQALPPPTKPQSRAAARSDVAPNPNPSAPVPPDRAADAVHRDVTFDHFTDRASQAMAARFAHASETAATASPPTTAVKKAAGMLGTLFRQAAPAYKPPSLNILKRPAAPRPSAEFTQPVLRGSARLLEDVLNDFSIQGEIKDIRPGPVVTTYEFEPARGTKSSRIVALADDIARSMSAASSRIAVVPGRNAIGIELPNVRRETVMLRELLESDAWRQTDALLPVVLGKGIGGEPVIADLARMPHLLIAGTTGSGKSVAVNAMILSLLFKHSPAECRLLLIDPKMLELSAYNGIPHLLAPVVTDPHQAAASLLWAVGEMEERYKRMAQLGVRNIEIFNTRVKNARKRGETVGRTVQTGFDERTGQATYEREPIDLEPMPFIVIVVDEFADLMVAAAKDIEVSVQRLAQMARAAGIHLVMATQRPSVDVVTGTIKANFPTRIAFKVASRIDSRTILNEQGAEQLLGAGDMLFASGAGAILRVHGPLVSDEEVERVAEALRQNGEAHYAEGLMRSTTPAGLLAGEVPAAPIEPVSQAPQVQAAVVADDADELFDRAVAIVHRDQKASTSYLQRRLSIGYNRAADLIDRMEREGLISPADAVGRRRVLMDTAGDDGDAAGPEADHDDREARRMRHSAA